jgi:hypothetical protein
MADEDSNRAAGDAWGDDISEERKAELQARLQAWEQEVDHGERKSPFDRHGSDVTLTGADVFWLAARMLVNTSEAHVALAHFRGRVKESGIDRQLLEGHR